MKRHGAVSTVFVLAILAVALLLGAKLRLPAAQQPAQKRHGCTVPSEWGAYRGQFRTGDAPGQIYLTFEDAAGTIRLVTAATCFEGEDQARVAHEVRRSK